MSPRTEEAYLHWMRRFVAFHGSSKPVGFGAEHVTAFLNALASRDHVAASTQNQALAALLFLYRDVYDVDLPWLDGLIRARRPARVPSVLSRDEVRLVLDRMNGTPRLMATLLYGSGFRLLECCRLRVKDVDFARSEITIRDGKGAKDRRTMLPGAVRTELQAHLRVGAAQHARDVAAGAGWVELPDALDRKFPNAGREWPWQWVFPATRTYHHAESGRTRRHHLHETVLQQAVRTAAIAASLPKCGV
jgi:integron integrase